ncbi:hypothetical protein Tco_1288961 [Tanacetum coccineum]
MSRTNPHATIISEEHLVPSANRLVIKKNDQRVASDLNITDTMLRFVDEFEWQAVDRTTKQSKMSKLMYTRFTKLIIAHFLSCNKSIPRRSEHEMHSEGQDLPLIKLINTIKDTCIFGMEIPDTMIDDAFKKSAGYKYYKAKKAESEKAKVAEKPEEQYVSPMKSGRGKGYIRLGDQEVNVPSAFKKNVVPRKTRSLTIVDNIVEELVVVELVKSISCEDRHCQQHEIITQLTSNRQIEKMLKTRSKASRLESLKQAKQAVAGKGSSAAHNKYHEFENISATDTEATQDSSRSNTDEEKDVEIDDSDDSKMDLSKDKPKRDGDAVGFGVFTLLNDPHANKFTDFMSNLVYTDAHITSVISLFTKQSTSVDDLSDMDLKLKLLEEIHLNKTHLTNQKLYDNLYDSILLDQEALDAQEVEPSFHKRSHDHQDPPTDREGEKRKKRQKYADQSSKSSRNDKAHMVQAQEDTPADQPQDQ